MKTFPKRLLTFVLAAAMVFGLSGMTAFAAEADDAGPQDASAEADDVGAPDVSAEDDSLSEPQALSAESGGEEGTVQTLADASGFPTSGTIPEGAYTLADDVYATDALTVAADTEVVIDLNGHVLTLVSGSVGLTIRGTLTIRDTSEYADGYITASTDRNGYEFYVTGTGSTLNLEGGGIKYITNSCSGSSSSWGVICVISGATFNMSGGTISGNACTNGRAGAIRLWSNVSFYMTGGTITDNYAGAGGGAIYADANGSSSSSNPPDAINISGGTITGNHAVGEGGGIYADRASLTLSGDARVYGNTSDTAGADFYKGNSNYDIAVTTTLRDQSADGLVLGNHVINGWYSDNSSDRWDGDAGRFTDKVEDLTITDNNFGLVAGYDSTAAEAEPTVDKTSLQKEYDQDRLLEEENYSAASWGPFAAALATAKTVLYDTGASQTEVDDALAALQAAKDALVRENPYDVKYAVSVWGIKQDIDEDYDTVGLTFGPATGTSYVNAYKAHLTKDAYNASEDAYCIHWMTWDEIIEQSKTDPTVFEDCMKEGCTRSVNIQLNDTLRGTSYNEMMDHGDGTGVLLNCLGSDYRRWNSANTSAGGWPASQIRAVLNGKDDLTGANADDAPDAEDALFTCLPSELQENIVAKQVKTDTVYNSQIEALNKTTCDKLWLFSTIETWGEGSSNTDLRPLEGALYDRSSLMGITTSDYSALISYNEIGSAITWWTRSLNTTTGVSLALNSGNLSGASANNTGYGLGFGFCLPGPEDPNVDKSALQAEYNEDVQLNESDYTPESWAPFAEALAAAKEVLDNTDATRKDVNEALNALRDTKDDLVVKGDGSKWQKVRYAVRIWGIGADEYSEDNGATTQTAGLTFGPALGDNESGDGTGYIDSYKAHLTYEEYFESDKPEYCIHWMSWDEIIEQDKKDPSVFEDCLKNGCTKSVELDTSNTDVFNSTALTFAMVRDFTGDGVSGLYYLVNSNYRAWNNNVNLLVSSDPANVYSRSRIRTTLIGDSTNIEAQLAAGGNNYYYTSSAPLLDASTCLLNYFPEELQSAVVSRVVPANDSGNDKTTYDKLWLPNALELGSTAASYDTGKDYGVITEDSERIAYEFDSSSVNNAATVTYATRSPNSTGNVYCDLASTGELEGHVASASATRAIIPFFSLPEQEPLMAFAVYDGEDASLTFYTDLVENVPADGGTYKGKEATEVYLDVDLLDARDTNDILWHDHAASVENVVIDASFAYAQPESLAFWFCDFSNAAFSGLGNVDISEVTSMESTFRDCAGAASLDLSAWDTTNVAGCADFATGCEALEWIKIGDSFDLFTKSSDPIVSQQTWYDSEENGLVMSDNYMIGVTNATSGNESGQYWTHTTFGEPNGFAVYCADDTSLTFYYGVAPRGGTTYNGKEATNVYTDVDGLSAGSAAEVPWTGLDTSVTDVVIDDSFAQAKPASLAYWFDGFNNASFDGLATIDTSEVTSLRDTFCNCAAATALDVSGWDTSHVTDMAEVFQNCAGLTTLDLSGWNTENVAGGSTADFATGLSDDFAWIRIGDAFDLFIKSESALVSQQTWYDSDVNGTVVSDNYMIGVTNAISGNESGQYWTYTEKQAVKPEVTDVTITSDADGNTKTYDGEGITLTAAVTYTPTDDEELEVFYQWYRVVDGTDTEIPGAEGSTCTTGGNVSDSGTYKCVVTVKNSAGSDDGSGELAVTIEQADQEISFEEPAIAATTADKTVTNRLIETTVDTAGGASISYASEDGAVATVDAETGVVTIVGVGTTKITASVTGTDNYKETSASYTLTVTADKEALEAAIDAANALIENEEKDNYTEDSWEDFLAALDAANGVYADSTASEDAVKQAAIDLMTAITNLKPAEQTGGEVDKTELLEAYADALELDESDYTQESWKAMGEALEKAQAVLLDSEATEEDVSDALTALHAAEEGLVKEVDKSALNAAIEEANALADDAEDYTPESWAKLESALKDAEAVAKDDTADQDDVNTALDALQSALDGLTARADTTVLEAAIKAADALAEDKDAYTEDSWNTLQDALKAAKEIVGNENAAQADVDSAASALLNALADLKPAEQPAGEVDKIVLEAAIQAADELEKDKDSYTEKSWSAVQDALKDAKEIMEQSDATQEQVDDVTVALVNAIANLKPAEKSDSGNGGNGGTPRNGLCQITPGKEWGYFVDDKVDTGYTGFASNKNGDWYVVNGYIHFDQNTVAKDTTGKNGDKGVGTKGTWYYVVGNKVQHDFTGLAHYKNQNGWWYIVNGKVDFTHNGVDKNQNGWWYVTGGKVQFGFTGLAHYRNQNGWWYISSGKVNFNANTVAKNQNGWWYVTGGKVQFGFTGLAHYRNQNGWWYIHAGKVTFDYNGIASNQNGTWYLTGSKVRFDYTGNVTAGGRIYNVVSGKVR